MRSTNRVSHRPRSLRLMFCVTVGACRLFAYRGAAAQEKAAAAAATAQKTFPTAQDTANALVSAAESFDRSALKALERFNPDNTWTRVSDE